MKYVLQIRNLIMITNTNKKKPRENVWSQWRFNRDQWEKWMSLNEKKSTWNIWSVSNTHKPKDDKTHETKSN
jgi:hypothetical protein